MEIFVHDTAFMIAYYRAQHESVSKDPYASIWPGPGVKPWIDSFTEQVSPHDEILHCLRNRFFFEELQQLAAEPQPLLVINLGAGFSMYPYTLPSEVVTVEVDFDAVAQYKRAKVKSFQKEGILPHREVHFMAADITNPEEQAAIIETLETYKGYKRVVLIEGVFFFLTKDEIGKVWSFCNKILTTEDRVMCVSFEDSLLKTPVFKRLTRYFSEVLKSDHNPYTTLPHSYYEHRDGFTLLKQESGFQLGQKLGVMNSNLDSMELLNEHFYVLSKI
ncbi:MAG: class I SAM-dependent methyltransferase [Bacteroidetes bacterium]|nr:class I SAM-dependent methyltransferase [Bacteroidota bacterium]